MLLSEIRSVGSASSGRAPPILTLPPTSPFLRRCGPPPPPLAGLQALA